jgi:hypothetical protein
MESSFFGIVTLTNLENVWLSDCDSIEKANTDVFMDETNIKIVHYPYSQQILIWLPVDGDFYQEMVICNLKSRKEIWRKEIREVISGTIKIELDTLPFKPGDFFIKINKKDGLQHIIYLKKYVEGIVPKETPPISLIESDEDKAPIIYRDGFGNIIPDQDLLIREKVLSEMNRKFSRIVKYEDSGRSGKVIYTDGDKTLEFYSEIGGGNCLFYINIPTKENWENESGYSLDERDDIILFVAENTLRDKTSSSGAYFEIGDKWITFYKGPRN